MNIFLETELEKNKKAQKFKMATEILKFQKFLLCFLTKNTEFKMADKSKWRFFFLQIF
jgi:hypothetical protein